MDIHEAQQKVLKLLRLAAGAPSSEEGRTAASMACRLIAEHGLLVMKPSDLVQTSLDASLTPAAARASSEKKPRRKRPSAKEIRETVSTVADTAATAIDAAGRIVSAVNGFRNIATGRS